MFRSIYFYEEENIAIRIFLRVRCFLMGHKHDGGTRCGRCHRLKKDL
jgi:hypothetical protein